MATFSLLGGVPYILESPAESQRANAALGMAQGNSAVSNFMRMREMRRQENRDAIADQRWEELRPFREAQLDGQVIENEGQRLNQKLFQASKLEEIENKALMDDSWWRSKMWNLQGWNEEAEADYYNWLSKNPQLGQTQWAKNMQEQFNFSKRAREAAALKQAEIQGRIDVANIRESDPEVNPPEFFTAPDGSEFYHSNNSWQPMPLQKRGNPPLVPVQDNNGVAIPGKFRDTITGQIVTADAEAYSDAVEDAKKKRGTTQAAPGEGQKGPTRIRFDKDGKRIE